MDRATQMNHWVALTAEFEETKESIAKLIYRHYKAGKVHDDAALDTCRRLDGLFADAKEFEDYLKDDFKTFLEAKGGKQATAADKAKNKALSFFANMHIKRNVASYKRNFRDTFLELGSRVVQAAEDGRVVSSDPQILQMIRYAQRCQKEANDRWEEVQVLQRSDGAAGNAFLTAIQSLTVSLTAYATTSGIPFLKRFVKQDVGLQQKLRDQYRKSLQAVRPGAKAADN